jgi:hypothetical protein
MAASKSIEHLRSRLDYDPDTGIFTWRNGPRAGKPAGSIRRRGKDHYQAGEPQCVKIGVEGSTFSAHRLAWAFVHGAWPEHVIDHCDGNVLNNASSNLRDVPQRVNLQNSRRHKGNKTGVTGVLYAHWRKHKPWRVQICVNYKIEQKFFSSRRAAVAWRRWKERKHGFHKNHGRNL